MIYLDTNVVVRLYEGDLKRLSPLARKRIDAEPLAISPMVLLELQYLYEIGRTRSHSHDVFTKLEAEIGLAVCGLPFPKVIASAVHENWTRDAFDRLIVAQAKAAGMMSLITHDVAVQEHYSQALG